MSEDNFKPTGQLEGDSKAMPNRGTSVGVTDTYGADLGQGAKNRKGGFDASSDPAFACCPPGGGDFSSSGHTSPDPGTGFSAGSDSADDVTPGDENMPGDMD